MRRTHLGPALALVLPASLTLAACTQLDHTGEEPAVRTTPALTPEHHLVGWAARSSPAPDAPQRTTSLSPPATADQPIRLVDGTSGVGASIRLAGAAPVSAVPSGAYRVFAQAAPFRDLLGSAFQGTVLLRVRPDGFEDFVEVPREPATPRIEYLIDLDPTVAGLRFVADTLELLDASGTPRLRVRPPYVADASGARHPAHLELEGCRADTDPSAPWGRAVTAPNAARCSLFVRWESEGMTYPALVDPAWSTTGSMSVRRDTHTATALDNGKVLVAGGRDTGALASAELYDPTTKTWAATGSMTAARSDHSAVLMTNGNVLVAGGRIAVAVNSVELYSTTAGTWSATASMNVARTGHRSVRLVTGEVLVAGGESISGKVASAEVFNPSLSSWQTVANMTTPRAGHTLTALYDGAVLAAGGENTGVLASAELYSRTNDNWLATDTMSSPRSKHAAVVLNNNKVLLTGGVNSAAVATAELYDPVAEVFSDVPPMTTARSAHASVLLSNGMALVAGGLGTAPIGASELFDPIAAAWIPSGNLVTARSGALALSLGNQGALLVGGRGTAGPLDSVEVFAQQANGAPCTQRGECDSGFCIDGVCCESACALGCMACSAAVKGQGTDGTCAPVKSGLDPDDDCQPEGNPPCQTAGTCNGTGGCSTIVGFQCAPSTCESELVQTNISVCNAALECIASGSTDCSPFQCKGGACLVTCTSKDDCMTGSACIQSLCRAPGADGTPCGTSSDCTSGHCVDGVCCDTDCSGTCQACKGSLKATGFDGTCGAAKFGVPCGATTCANSQVTGQLCNSTGQCLSQSASCSPFASCADTAACPSECTADGDCISSHYCDPTGACAPLLLTGSPCAGATQCKTGFCVDSVCCSTSCGNGATDDCRACSAAAGGTSDGVCAALDGVACATGMCSSGLCKAVPEAGPDVEEAGLEAAVDAPEDIAQEAAQDATPDGPADSAVAETEPEAGPEAALADANTEPDAKADAASQAPAEAASSDSGGCSCRTAPAQGGSLWWIAAIAALAAAGRRRKARGLGVNQPKPNP